MIFYSFNALDILINDNLINNLKEERENIKQIKNLYNNKKSNLSLITTNEIETSEQIDNNKLNEFHQNISSLKNSFEDIEKIELLISKLDDNITLTISLYEKSLEYNQDEIKANLVEYNKQRDELFNKILQFENSTIYSFNSLFELKPDISPQEIIKDTTNITKTNIELEPSDNNTLIISEKDQKAYLPFSYNKVNEIYYESRNIYNTLQDVIEDLYILPLNRFKNSSISRFKEAFYLIRKKEKGSITKALDLGLELMFKYELNPIIIAACKNLDELDIYLDCLEEGELDDFPCFKIKFEVMPKLAKNANKNTF